jgi:predicted nucleotidyltransferase component of viral defense system
MSSVEDYRKQVALLLDVLPVVKQIDCFALKGGTALNLFIRDMPRLSVDIDLAYLPVEPREAFLSNFNNAMQTLAGNLEAADFNVIKRYDKHNLLVKLDVANDAVNIKIEPNTVLRGSVFPTELQGLSEKVQETFLQQQKVRLLSFADLYAGKICAALDRQHPRDLFDVKLLLENEGITDDIRQAFVIYLACSPRPMSELLAPNELDVRDIYNKEFVSE